MPTNAIFATLTFRAAMTHRTVFLCALHPAKAFSKLVATLIVPTTTSQCGVAAQQSIMGGMPPSTPQVLYLVCLYIQGVISLGSPLHRTPLGPARRACLGALLQ